MLSVILKTQRQYAHEKHSLTALFSSYMFSCPTLSSIVFFPISWAYLDPLNNIC